MVAVDMQTKRAIKRWSCQPIQDLDLGPFQLRNRSTQRKHDALH